MEATATQNTPQSVIITAIQATCEAHGWIPGSEVFTVEPAVDGFKDTNGLNIYVHSVLRNRRVWLNSNEYKVPVKEVA